ncbi:MAG: hypothetical protein JNK76_12775 [Planctomycetales bacterium]|nr:hypothetical protein [Planctomycetales bacterium]
MIEQHRPRATFLVAFVVISLAVVGYFVGLQSPMNPPRETERAAISETKADHAKPPGDVMPATGYLDMAAVTERRASVAGLAGLKSSIDPLAEFRIEPGEKQVALAARRRNRAFNGAPPTIPHAVEQRSSAACLACHGNGGNSTSLRIPRMSHAFLANCTQCHVESSPKHMTASQFRENSFEGMAAPDAGPRAFAEAPPQIPHTTWMRNDCMSCHGYAGLNGIRTTHPWRRNCEQCHAPSSELDQTLLAAEPKFLPGPKLKSNN